MRSGIELSQFLRVFLPTLGISAIHSFLSKLYAGSSMTTQTVKLFWLVSFDKISYWLEEQK